MNKIIDEFFENNKTTYLQWREYDSEKLKTATEQNPIYSDIHEITIDKNNNTIVYCVHDMKGSIIRRSIGTIENL